MKRFLEHIKKQLKDVKPFSWQTALLTSLFCWTVYLLIREPGVKQFVSIFAWFFLIVGTDWALLEKEKADKKKEKELTIPGINFKLRLSPWITGLLLVLALYSNRFLVFDTQDALVSWPLFSAGFAAFPRFLKPGPTFKVPEDAAVRQDLVTITLVASLLSCWFQFNFLLQDFLRQYPSLQADNFDNSAFVVRWNFDTAIPIPAGVRLLNQAEEIVRDDLGTRSWADVQRWLQTIDRRVPSINTRVKTAVFGNPPLLKESQLWQFNAAYTPGIPDSVLQLQEIWRGPSSQTNGYILEKSCLVTQAPVQTTPDANSLNRTTYRMDCRAITSNAKEVNVGG